MLPTIAPACTCAKPASASTVILFHPDKSSTQPPLIGDPDPVSEDPDPRVVTGTLCLLASSSTVVMSARVFGLMTASGRNDSLLPSNDAANTASWSVVTRRPSLPLSFRVAGPKDGMEVFSHSSDSPRASTR
jgi:hypothetical protein